MSKATMSTERLDRLRACCDAYGADPARWPDALREEFSSLYLSDEAADIRADAQSLDGFLNAASAPRMSEDLERRIMATYAVPTPKAGLFGFFSTVFPLARLVPAGALAGVGAIGVLSGMMAASAQTPVLTPESEALVYLDEISFAALNDEEGLQWNAD